MSKVKFVGKGPRMVFDKYMNADDIRDLTDAQAKSLEGDKDFVFMDAEPRKELKDLSDEQMESIRKMVEAEFGPLEPVSFEPEEVQKDATEPEAVEVVEPKEAQVEAVESEAAEVIEPEPVEEPSPQPSPRRRGGRSNKNK